MSRALTDELLLDAVAGKGSGCHSPGAAGRGCRRSVRGRRGRCGRRAERERGRARAEAREEVGVGAATCQYDQGDDRDERDQDLAWHVSDALRRGWTWHVRLLRER